ncbi:MAG: VIT1/CCC1 transporter family protein [Patescibacteria group bacterium]|nr:VIT1/CCC1 transporter family protein [Patescibacteria group bacterium]
MNEITAATKRALVLDELFDLTFYERLRVFTPGDTGAMLDRLIAVESRHLAFWQDFFALPLSRLDLGRRVKLSVMLALARLFGKRGILLLLEAIEVYGIKKYLAVWEAYPEEPLKSAVAGILRDEFEHENAIVSDGTSHRLHPERVRDLFLGFNDGLIEVIGAISGFFAVFQTVSAVLLAGVTVAVAGAFSMAAGAYAAVGSEKELDDIHARKQRFLGAPASSGTRNSPVGSALVVGISYFIGALIPLAPVFFGAESLPLSITASLIVAILVSYIVAFLSGMDTRRRILINIAIVVIAVSVTSVLGLIAKGIFGVNI